jgi:hypothetical protein
MWICGAAATADLGNRHVITEILDADRVALECVDDNLRAVPQTELVQHAGHVGSDSRLAHMAAHLLGNSVDALAGVLFILQQF